MAISPLSFALAAPVPGVERLERVKRRNKAEAKMAASDVDGSSLPRSYTRAPLSPEELASDATQEALQNIRLGG